MSPSIPGMLEVDVYCITEVRKTEKKCLETYLSSWGWEVVPAWGFTRGIDIEAKRGQDRWVIEMEGRTNSGDSLANSFNSVLGKVLQRMDDPNSKYSVALPDSKQFRRLWKRLPELVKNRTGITALFVDQAGIVSEILY